MLLLTRKKGQKIVIDSDIIITVIAMSGNQVKLGIDAPKSIPVNREEIQEKIDGERDEAR